MNRRNLITGVAALSVPAPGAKAMTAIFELRYFRLRNGEYEPVVTKQE